MTQTVWAHLPNAKHIDWVLASLESYPEKWALAYTASDSAYAAWDAAYGAASGSAYTAASDAAWFAAFAAANNVAYNTARGEARDAVWDAAFDAATDTITALIAYDDCAYMIESEVGELKIIAAFGDQRAILLLPACIVYNETKVLA